MCLGMSLSLRTGAGAAAGAAAPAAGNVRKEAAESCSIVLRSTTEVVEYQQALREAGGSADPVSAGGGALSTASSAAVHPAAATAAASTAGAAASTAASRVTIAEYDALKLKYTEVVAQLNEKTAENLRLLNQNECLQLAAVDKCIICQDTIKQQRVAAAAGQRQPRAGEVAEADGEQSHEMEVEEQEVSALRPRGSLPLPNFQQLKWCLDGVPEDVIVASDGVTKQLYDAAVAAGTLLVRTEDEAKEWEARRSPLPPAAFSNLSGCTHSPSPRPTRDSSRRPRWRLASRPARATTAPSSGKRPGSRVPSSRAMVSRSSTR